ncbi:MAG: DUF2950 family protein, partial [Candidatus Binataceae bacterium]
MPHAIDNNRNTSVCSAIQLIVIGFAIGLFPYGPALAQEPGQKTFDSPAAAAEALDAAIKHDNDQQVLAIMGQSATDIIKSGDPVADKANRANFVTQYSRLHQFAAAGDGRTFLYIGQENWPMPIPLRKSSNGWYFDTAYGRQEILFRRIGRNELKVIRVCKAIVEAEHDFYSASHDGNPAHQYTRKFNSTPGSQDGLYWQVKAGQHPESPLGPLVAEAAVEGYAHHKENRPRRPFHGYIYRLLTGQGAGAAGGAKDFVVNGAMTGGFAVVAYPANYRVTGVMTFIVNQDGRIYQKDLGPR